MYTFVNGQFTREGGTHLAAFRESVARVLKEFYKKNYAPEDCRHGISGAISIQIQEPHFNGQTKNKLGSTYMWEKGGKQGPTIKSFMNDFLSIQLPNYLLKHKDVADAIEAKIKSSQSEREQIAAVRSSKGDSIRRSRIYNENLNDCQYHFCDRRTPANTLPVPPHRHRECRKNPEDWHVHQAIHIFVHMNISSSLYLLFPGA
jgi:topoisomerase-4 subunit B